MKAGGFAGRERMSVPSKCHFSFHSLRGICDRGGGRMGGRTTPQSAILPPLVQSECPRKETEGPGAVYGASFFRNRCFTGWTRHCRGEQEEEEEGQVIKTGADRQRRQLKAREEETRRQERAEIMRLAESRVETDREEEGRGKTQNTAVTGFTIQEVKIRWRMIIYVTITCYSIITRRVHPVRTRNVHHVHHIVSRRPRGDAGENLWASSESAEFICSLQGVWINEKRAETEHDIYNDE